MVGNKEERPSAAASRSTIPGRRAHEFCNRCRCFRWSPRGRGALGTAMSTESLTYAELGDRLGPARRPRDRLRAVCDCGIATVMATRRSLRERNSKFFQFLIRRRKRLSKKNTTDLWKGHLCESPKARGCGQRFRAIRSVPANRGTNAVSVVSGWSIV